MRTKLKSYAIAAAVILTLIYFGLNVFSYFSPFPWCRIRIHANLAGNRGTIKSAINLLKSSDKSAYGTLCNNVNFIYENYCIDKDWHLFPNDYLRSDAGGCFIKGSHSVYLTPSKDASAAEIRARAAELKKLAELAKEFWSSRR